MTVEKGLKYMDDRDEADERARAKRKNEQGYANEADEKDFAIFLKMFAPRSRSVLAFLIFTLAVQKKLIRLSMR